ncbi:MAG TPA: L,D-transpeptidase [Anaerolineales bacterium]|nr:L,D-transpeptidase [Anaerolineales bacterium]
MPGIYRVDPLDCLPLGPSSYMTSLAAQGISLPLYSLPYHPIDATLAELPYHYALLGEGQTKVYASLQDAMAGKNEVGLIEAGRLRYISYDNYEETAFGRFFNRTDGTWVAVSSRVSVPHSYPGGIEFSRTPMHAFGWILPFDASVETKRTPGYGLQDNTGHSIKQYEIVQVYSTKIVNNEKWDLVAPDEWLNGRYIGMVTPTLTPPPGVENGRWIEVNLFEQTLAVYDQGQLVYATLVATGVEPFFTKPGLFQVQRKLDSTTMSGSFAVDRSDYYYLEDVPWTMYYDHARALHGAYWRTAFGYPQSHGCINLSPADSHWLFNWANVGDWVYVWDPSGNTPTDPSYYGEGGA